MTYYKLNPEVPGHFGDDAELERVNNTFEVKKMHLVFDGWQGDDLLTNHPVFMVTERLKDAISKFPLSGFSVTRIDNIETSEEYETFFGNKEIPPIFWLKVIGNPYIDDFGINEDNDLVVSQKTLDIMQKFNMNLCRVEAVEGEK